MDRYMQDAVAYGIAPMPEQQQQFRQSPYLDYLYKVAGANRNNSFGKSIYGAYLDEIGKQFQPQNSMTPQQQAFLSQLSMQTNQDPMSMYGMGGMGMPNGGANMFGGQASGGYGDFTNPYGMM